MLCRVVLCCVVLCCVVLCCVVLFGVERTGIIRSMWQFGAICQFLHLFRKYLQIPTFSCSDVESGLCYPVDHPFMYEVMWKVLLIKKSDGPKKSVRSAKMDKYVLCRSKQPLEGWADRDV